MNDTTLACDGYCGTAADGSYLQCPGEVTMIDDKGWVYCTAHGTGRRMNSGRRCRKLRSYELRRLDAGRQLARY